MRSTAYAHDVLNSKAERDSVLSGSGIRALTRAAAVLGLLATLGPIIDRPPEVEVPPSVHAPWTTWAHASRPGFPSAAKFVVFGLFGDSDADVDGALENAAAVPLYFLTWRAMFIIDVTVPDSVRHRLRQTGAEIVALDRNVSDWGDGRHLLPFLALGDPGVQYALFRHVRARISAREIAAVNSWLQTNRTFHIMRDHPHQTFVLPAGLWGVHADALRVRMPTDLAHSIGAYVQARLPYPPPGTSQGWLLDVVWPWIGADNAVIHDAFHCGGPGRPFPLSRDYHGEYVGLVQDTAATESDPSHGRVARWPEYRRHGSATFSSPAPEACRLLPHHLFG